MTRIKMQRTFVALKPDAVQRGLIGEIIARFEKKGLKIVALKMVHPNLELAEAHYAEHKGKDFYPSLIKFITEGPIVAMVLEGIHAIAEARKMMGATDPQNSAPGTIRADYAQVKESNIVHGSDSEESAQREINLYFKPEELCMGREIISEYYIKKYAKV
ncbi:MAG: nucleoside-diphosphate kinase [Candidatus Gastranaerophilales bacterium]|nr:nucleoside-diphosphate kinase [Candidatus Gastranaerophilales bacterium]